ncbi:MAG: Heme/copper-type cytochrome/quinol [Rhodospirillaceae bacterium]|nr:MAG: Heme/copper-type cytochrome/quinol [Rhodospirillaceae bacterium]TNC93703.1 MAG: Heme/copper-type cytochrome/quinol oxidase [Stygiobacter sp.]
MIRALPIAAFAVLAMFWPGWTEPEADMGEAVEATAFIARVHAYAGLYSEDAPAGEIPMLARRFEFYPAVRLQSGQSYRLLLMAEDAVHSVVVNGREMLLVPGMVQAVELSPRPGDVVELRCNEYCGLGHNRMRLRIH